MNEELTDEQQEVWDSLWRVSYEQLEKLLPFDYVWIETKLSNGELRNQPSIEATDELSERILKENGWTEYSYKKYRERLLKEKQHTKENQ